MTIANDNLSNNDTTADNEGVGNPAPFSKYVDMSLIDSKEIGVASDGASLPSWDDVKQLLLTNHYKEVNF